MIPVFILTYNESDYLNHWLINKNYKNFKFHIIDNGKQHFTKNINEQLTYQTEYNIGTTGGYNLCFKIAFDYFNYDKIIFQHADTIASIETLKKTYRTANSDNIVIWSLDESAGMGGLWGLHKDVLDKVGYMDENYVISHWEDADYRMRVDRCESVELIDFASTEQKPKDWDSLVLHYEHITRETNPDIDNIWLPYNSEYHYVKWGWFDGIDVGGFVPENIEDNSTYKKYGHTHLYDIPFENIGNTDMKYVPLKPERYERIGMKNLKVFPSDYEYKRFLSTN